MSAGGPRGLLFPILLIALGLAILLGNLGYLPPISWAAAARLWPVLLMVLGIELIVGRRRPLVALGLELGVIALALAALAGSATLAPLVAPGTVTREATVPRDGAQRLELRIAGGAGTYALEGGAAALVEARATGVDLRVIQERSGSTAEVRVEPVEQVPFFFRGESIEVRTRVASDVPLSVHVDGGAGDFLVDLSSIRATDARISLGAASLRIVLPRPTGDVPLRVDAGAASVEIVVPPGIEASIVTRGGAVSLSSSNDRLRAESGAAQTAGYSGAADRVTVTVQGGATSVTIR